VQELYERLNKLEALPYPPEPEPEPVYTSVLVPNYEFGDPMIDGAELHTAESLLEALEHEMTNGYGFKLYKLGPCILTVPPAE
jgi:hypothetical protein